MILSSLPSRPLKEPELRSLHGTIENTAPMVIRPDQGGSDIYAAVLVQTEYVTAIIFEEDSWRVLDRHERPHPPSAFEEQFRDWVAEYPELIALC